MDNLRKHGNSPFSIAVLHGGPGAAGEMAPVARELSLEHGVLEPLQTAPSIVGQVDELRTLLENHAELPVTLIGFSWGAWLTVIFTAQYPSFVSKIILIGAGPFDEIYAAEIQKTRMSRLNETERFEVESLTQLLTAPVANNRNHALERFGTLLSKADAYDPVFDDSDTVDIQFNIFRSVWREAALLRSSGKLLELAKQIQCPVTAIHGDYDPHPADGVQIPLSAILSDFRFVLLKNCGHKPWIEHQARDDFYRILKSELL
jgi:pimeloyl-ACP methyl ester carboxylesterase